MYGPRVATATEVEQAAILNRPVTLWVLLPIAAHIPLAIAVNKVSILAAVHAGVVLFVGLVWSTFGRRVDRVAYVTAYVTGAEVFWRMTNNRLPWELGKYSVVLICTIAIVRIRGLKGLLWPLLGLALLLPSAALTVTDLPPDEAWNQLAFNLSGPLALLIAARFFSAISLTSDQLRRTLIVIVAPVAAIAAVVFYGIATNPDIVWTTESNFATSGGFGPNQVSAALGLGALAAFLCACDSRIDSGVRLVCVGALVWFSTQSVLTFSRGGMYCAAGGAIASAIYLIRNPQTRINFVIVGVVVYLFGTQVIWPQLDKFTDGAISARFSDTGTTGRSDISREDIDIWLSNVVLGVGPGRSRFFHGHGAATHTELTRLLSEHGLFGVAALLLLTGASVRNVRRGRTARDKGMAAAFVCWSVLFMFSAAMRLVAPSFIFGLAFATFIDPPAAHDAEAAESASEPQAARSGQLEVARALRWRIDQLGSEAP